MDVFIKCAIVLVILYFVGKFIIRTLLGIFMKIDDKKRAFDGKRYENKKRRAIDKTERGKNRAELRAVMKKFIVDRGGLGYVYANYISRESAESFSFQTKTGENLTFAYKNYGFGNVSADAAEDIFKRLAEELGGIYNASKEEVYGGAGSSGYVGYGDVSGAIHVVPGASDTSSRTKVRTIGIYTKEGWERQKTRWAQEDAEKNKYKKV